MNLPRKMQSIPLGELPFLEIPPGNRVNTISGGLQSWVATWLDFRNHPKSTHLLYFCDTGYEHPTTYDFISRSLDVLSDDFPETPAMFTCLKSESLWELFSREKFQGNGRNAVCSHKLKQEPGKKLEALLGIEDSPITFGFGPLEPERLENAKRSRKNPVAPLLDDDTFWDKQALIGFVKSKGLDIPYLYQLGMAHNNCSGFCVKAGQGHYKSLLNNDAELYAQHEENQEAFINSLDDSRRGSVGFITVQRRGKKYRLTLKEFRLWIERGEPVDPYDKGACGCFSQV